MTIEEAFSIIDQACGSVQADRKTHILISQALDIIKKELDSKSNPEKIAIDKSS